jgi:hypothetical protein
MVLNVVTDLYLLSIPLPLLWQVKIGLRRKIPLMALFSGAAFVIAAAIIRAIMVTTVSSIQSQPQSGRETNIESVSLIYHSLVPKAP